MNKALEALGMCGRIFRWVVYTVLTGYTIYHLFIAHTDLQTPDGLIALLLSMICADAFLFWFYAIKGMSAAMITSFLFVLTDIVAVAILLIVV